jgi:hypothetical protein
MRYRLDFGMWGVRYSRNVDFSGYHEVACGACSNCVQSGIAVFPPHIVTNLLSLH